MIDSLILGIESSCDETSVALLQKNTILANTIYTQKIHSSFGGVVPEIASRAHIQKIDRLCEALLIEQNIKPSDISLIAVTDTPGLAGALLVGVSFALGMHTAYSIPIIGVNHLEGHISSVKLQYPDLSFPFLSLVVSGGHTAIYKVSDYGIYENLGQTIDDAAGEAFDKVGKMIGFSYPAGQRIEETALRYLEDKVIDFPVAKIKSNNIDFSFSGLKTAVKYWIQYQGDNFSELMHPYLCYSFQNAVIRAFIKNLKLAVKKTGINTVTMVGGVACNATIRSALMEEFDENAYFPSPILCTDNAAMIAKAGAENFNRGRFRFPLMKPTGARSAKKERVCFI